MFGLFRQVGTEAVLGAVISSVSRGKGEPRVYKLSSDAFDLVLRIVECTRPGEAIRVEWFRLIGVSDEGVGLILRAYDLFSRRAHENEIKRLICALKPLDFELLSLFFHLLKNHYDQRLVPLDATTAREQELAARHKASVPPEQHVTPKHLMEALSCCIAGCGELKNYIVQRTRMPLFSGFQRISWDPDIGADVCTSKKTIMVSLRNEDRQRPEAAVPGRDSLLDKLRSGDTSSFYGSYESVSNLCTVSASLEEQQPLPQGKRKRRDGTGGGRRENLERSFVPEISKKLEAYASALKANGIEPTAHALYSLDYVPKEAIDRLSSKQMVDVVKSRNELDSACKQEERRISKNKTLRPCFEMPVLRAPINGYVFEKDVNRNKVTSVAATLCRSCGCTFDFSLRLAYANGITCGCCDAAERRLLYAPRCFICRRSRLERCSAGQGMTTVQREHNGWLRSIAILDDSSDWMPRAVRVCDGCWCDWMRTEPRTMTVCDVLYHLHRPANSAMGPIVARRGGFAPNFRRERRIRSAPISDLVDEKSWPSKRFVEALNEALGLLPPKPVCVRLKVLRKPKKKRNVEFTSRDRLQESARQLDVRFRLERASKSSHKRSAGDFVVSRGQDLEQ